MDKIVVGVDGSPGARAALRWAVHEALLRDVPLEIVYARVMPPSADFAMVPYPELKAAADAIVEHARDEATRIASGAPFEVSTWIVEEATAPALIGASESADLLVVGSRGHGAFTGMLLGSVSLHCITHADCPVVVVRPLATDELDTADGA